MPNFSYPYHRDPETGLTTATRQDLKTIVITWTNNSVDYRYDGILAALWIAEGTDKDLNTALEYLHKHYPDSGRVHTFPTDELNWKIKALQCHVMGRSL